MTRRMIDFRFGKLQVALHEFSFHHKAGMSAVVNPLSFEEHRDLGREVLKTRARMLHVASVVASVYGPQSRTAFTFAKVNEAMDKLCVEMQAQAEQDCPGLNTSSFYR